MTNLSRTEIFNDDRFKFAHWYSSEKRHSLSKVETMANLVFNDKIMSTVNKSVLNKYSVATLFLVL